MLAAELASGGFVVTGVDPAGQMLEFARSRPGGEQVRGLHVEASTLETASADLVLMTGHVSQVFLTDDDWDVAVRACLRALRAGGHLAFQTRNPDSKAWLRWTREDTLGSYPLPDGSAVQSWNEVTGVSADLVSFEGDNLFSATLPAAAAQTPMPESGTDLVATSTLRFRTQARVASLLNAGFEVRAVYGDWDRGPIRPTSSELIFLTRRP